MPTLSTSLRENDGVLGFRYLRVFNTIDKSWKSSEHYGTAVRPSHHRSLLEEAARDLDTVELSSGATVRAWRSTRMIAGAQREVVVVFSARNSMRDNCADWIRRGGALRNCWR